MRISEWVNIKIYNIYIEYLLQFSYVNSARVGARVLCMCINKTVLVSRIGVCCMCNFVQHILRVPDPRFFYSICIQFLFWKKKLCICLYACTSSIIPFTNINICVCVCVKNVTYEPSKTLSIHHHFIYCPCFLFCFLITGAFNLSQPRTQTHIPTEFCVYWNWSSIFSFCYYIRTGLLYILHHARNTPIYFVQEWRHEIEIWLPILDISLLVFYISM